MKRQDVYDTLEKTRNQIVMKEHFTDEVMNQICHYEQKKRKTSFDIRWFVKLISTHPLAQAALVAVGAMTGFIRVVFIILVILNKGDING